MTKQQLAAKIWESANKMRSKIDASEYKDYILGLIFYKFLSDKEVEFLTIKAGMKDEELVTVEESNKDVFNFIRENLGYFISYEHLFSSWIDKGIDFQIADVRDALSAFDRTYNRNYVKLFKNIFSTLQTGLSKLGDTSSAQSKAIRDLIHLIKDIPTSSNDYDVLGFIYEYLIHNFAANAGKKAGEFYTPNEVSILMSEIVAHHLRDKDEIKIYDPTSGSGSLLINIGKSVSRQMKDRDKIKYYAQELEPNTYNLTRMNLIMRGINVSNIEARQGDTLAEDWPYFDEEDPAGTYEPVFVDAVVSNPPYSAKWEPKNNINNSRFVEYGIAPKSKADYAFLLHDLYHIKPDGIVTIVLPHGVLFRGGEEQKIRKNLVERGNIRTVIGLPANIFFGTGIPTIIMILKKGEFEEDEHHIHFIDASKNFVKSGNKNKLRESDIKRIADTVINRAEIENFSRLVSLDKIRENEYNLNISRYIDSGTKKETYDIYSLMFGGIPKQEVNELKQYWKEFPSLKRALFEEINENYVSLKAKDIKSLINENDDINNFNDNYRQSFDDFDEFLEENLIDSAMSINIAGTEIKVSDEIFRRFENINLIDKYDAFQIFAERWYEIANDLEIIQEEGFESLKKVDPKMIYKNNDEVQDGWQGRVLPFTLVQQEELSEQVNEIAALEEELKEVGTEITDLIEQFDEDDREKSFISEDYTKFNVTELNKEINCLKLEIESPELDVLNNYLILYDSGAKKAEKLEFVEKNHIENWENIVKNSDGTPGKTNVTREINRIINEYQFEENTYPYYVIKAKKLLDKEKSIKADIKEKTVQIDLDTQEMIKSLSDERALYLLKQKWITPLIDELYMLPNNLVDELSKQIEMLSLKYEATLSDIYNEIADTESELAAMLDELEGDDFDMKGLEEFKKLLRGN